MLSTVLVEHPWLTTVTLAALVLLGPLAGAWLVAHRRTTAVLLGALLAVVALLVHRRLSGDCERALVTSEGA